MAPFDPLVAYRRLVEYPKRLHALRTAVPFDHSPGIGLAVFEQLSVHIGFVLDRRCSRFRIEVPLRASLAAEVHEASLVLMQPALWPNLPGWALSARRGTA